MIPAGSEAHPVQRRRGAPMRVRPDVEGADGARVGARVGAPACTHAMMHR
jgi:hypothetical protein